MVEDIPRRNKIILGAVGGAMLLLASISLTLGVADMFSIAARQKITNWQYDRNIEKTSDWDIALGRQMWAVSMNPLHPGYMADLGMILEWKATSMPPWKEQAMVYGKLAAEQYRKAIHARPSWSVGWIHLAKVKAYFNEFDAETFNAMQNAIILDPRRLDVRLTAISIGLASWDIMPRESRETLGTTIVKVIQNRADARVVFKMAVDMGREDVLESLAPNKKAKEALSCLSRARKEGGNEENCRFNF